MLNIIFILSLDPTYKLKISLLDGDSVCMNGTQINILKKTNYICLKCLMDCLKHINHVSKGIIELVLCPVCLCNFTDCTIDCFFRDKEMGETLVSPDFFQSHRSLCAPLFLLSSCTYYSWTVLHCTCCSCRILPGSFSTNSWMFCWSFSSSCRWWLNPCHCQYV